jgi:hypothetical protein
VLSSATSTQLHEPFEISFEMRAGVEAPALISWVSLHLSHAAHMKHAGRG